jgi:hypothetical protein
MSCTIEHIHNNVFFSQYSGYVEGMGFAWKRRIVYMFYWPFIFSVFSHDTAGLLATSHLFMTYVMNIW